MVRRRLINIELLRILAMLMVLGLHANFTALKPPASDVIMTGGGICRTFGEFSCIVAVNTFVMISGWFGIKTSLCGFTNFMWQVIYCVGVLFIVGVIAFSVPVNIHTILWTFGLYGGGGWFVAAYIGLYIIAPILNLYLRHQSLQSVVMLLICFFAFEFVWGNTKSVEWISSGYSTFSFIGIYVLAGLLRRLELDLRLSLWFYVFMFFVSVSINTLIFVFADALEMAALRSIILNYINPLVIIGAASLLLAFAKSAKLTPPDCCMQNDAIQRVALWVAASCFAAYLLHVGTGYALELYCDGVRYLYNSYSGIAAFLMILGYILAVFFAAVLIDQPRKLIWRKMLLPLFDRK